MRRLDFWGSRPLAPPEAIPASMRSTSTSFTSARARCHAARVCKWPLTFVFLKENAAGSRRRRSFFMVARRATRCEPGIWAPENGFLGVKLITRCTSSQIRHAIATDCFQCTENGHYRAGFTVARGLFARCHDDPAGRGSHPTRRRQSETHTATAASTPGNNAIPRPRTAGAAGITSSTSRTAGTERTRAPSAGTAALPRLWSGNAGTAALPRLWSVTSARSPT